MIGLYITAAIIILLTILLNSPFRIYISCENNKFSAVVGYLFYKKTVFPKQKKKNEKKSEVKKRSDEKKKKKSDGGKSDKEESTEKKKKKFFPEKKDEQLRFIINILKSSGAFLKRFTKRITIKDITADIDISDEDACDCAIKFGKANMIVFNALSFCNVFFKIKKKYIRINCVYNKPKSVYNLKFTVSFTPAAGILSAFAFIFTFLVNNRKAKKGSRPENNRTQIETAE